MISPSAPPNTAAVPTRLPRARTGPPLSIRMLISPPIAGSSPTMRCPVMTPAASGTQIASTARSMVPHGGGTFAGRITSASQSGATPLSQSGTVLTRPTNPDRPPGLPDQPTPTDLPAYPTGLPRPTGPDRPPGQPRPTSRLTRVPALFS